MSEHFDVLVVGAGLSGIGAGWHLQTLCPDRSYAILEGRAAIGGTWDLFRYPGIRSDSDMYTLGYRFKPWREAKAIADGPSILSYVRDTAAEHGIDHHIRFGHHVKSAAWDSDEARWTVVAEHDGRIVELTCGFLYMCSGYYDYAQGHAPDFAGSAAFAGRIVHPQHWPEDLDHAGKRVVVIGSGATAVTLVPAMAATAAHVVMLQRSPSYVITRPAIDGVADWLRRTLPMGLAYGLARWKNVLLGMMFFNKSRKEPAKVRGMILDGVRAALGPDYDVETHFNPRYNPWDQRLCFVPDSDLFDAINAGRASVVTDQVERFTETGIVLKSGETIDADIIVTATGLTMQLLSGMTLTVDGAPVALNQALNYKGMMFSDVPNLATAFGYTNASWTLKADLTSEYVCRLLNHMRHTGARIATPHRGQDEAADAPFLDFSSGYVTRAMDQFPKQGTRAPWKVHQNYIRDLLTLRHGRIADGTMVFSNPRADAATPVPLREAAE